MKKVLCLTFSLFLFASVAKAQQTADVTITLNENFFDALLDAVFTNLPPPSFPLAAAETKDEEKRRTENESAFAETAENTNFLKTNFIDGGQASGNLNPRTGKCDEAVRLIREIDGVRTAVRFRDGRINAPLAFTGSFNPPLIGCVNFQGWADSTIELEFDRNTQSLIGRAKVSDVRINGTGGVGSSLIARLVQSSIDKKINPIRILQMDKVSFAVPVQNAGTLQMKAIGMRHEITNGAMNVHITYQFSKAN